MELNLRDLSDRVGIEPRTIRSYIEKGLLPGPEGAGRSAAYGERHLNRLWIIKVRKDRQGWALEDIRRQLLGMTELEIRELAEALSAEEQVWTKGLDELPASPLEYVKAVQARRSTEPWGTEPPSDFADRSSKSLQGPDWLAVTGGDKLELKGSMQLSRRPPRGTKAKLVYEIEVTPDVSLVVKGLGSGDHFSELKLRRFEAIAERLRELLNSPPEDIEELVKRLEDLG